MLLFKNRPTRQNLSLTQKYFTQYFNFSTLVSQTLLINCFVLVLSIFYCNVKTQEQFLILVLGTTAITSALGLLLVGGNVLKAHRMADVHMKMEKMFDQIREGNMAARLQLPQEDHLNSLEKSFNLMMDYLNQRVK